jgi:hypothetical protein
MLTIRSITNVAYMFRDADLVHSLLGIAPCTDLGCTAVFIATQFRLHHHKNLILQGTRHSANLWQIALNLSNVTLTPAPALHQYDDSALPVLLMYDNTLLNEDYIHSSSPARIHHWP